MEIYDFDSLLRSQKKREKEMVIAIGVFDGVHKGHQKIFETVRKEVEKHPGYESMCITFSTNPKNRNTGCLDTMRLREEYVSSFSINSFTIIDFSENFSKISASGFAESIVKLCRPRILVVGSDFKCGNPQQSADGRKLVQLFASYGAEVELITVDFVLSEKGEKISSTLLRQLIIKGDLESYSRFSGQDYHLDLLTEPSRCEDGIMVFSRERISQLLPPPGAYEGTFVNRDKKRISAEVSISEDDISIHAVEALGDADSLFITRRKVK